MKKASCLLIALLMAVLPCLPAQAADEGYVPGFDITAEAVYLYNLETDDLVFARNKDKQLPPASLTKIMTCILALETTSDLDTEIVTYPAYVQNELYEYQLTHGAISLAGDLRAGEQLTMRQALYALMLPSANEVAMSIADHIAGGQAEFAELMNQRAKELGAVNTNFVNPNGLYHEEHLTTAYDIAQITMHALTIPEFVEITSTSRYESGATTYHENIVWESTNEMMNPDSSYYFAGLKGVKTGSVPQAGRCFVSTATRDGYDYLLVVMKSDYYDEEGNVLAGNRAFDDTANIYSWVFSTFKVKTVVDKGKHEAGITLRLSMDQDYIRLMTSERLTVLLSDTVDVSRDIQRIPILPDSINAPVVKGDRVGEMSFVLNGEEIGRVDLLAAETVEASPILLVLDQLQRLTTHLWFKWALVFVALLVILYIVLTILRNRKRRKNSYRPRRRI